MEIFMKKLFLALILVAGLELKAADAAPTEMVKIQTSDGCQFSLPLSTPFGTINNVINDLGNDSDEPVPLPNVNSKTFTDILSLYNSGVVPENSDRLVNL